MWAATYYYLMGVIKMDENRLSINVDTYVPGGKRNLRKNFNLTKEDIDKYIRKCLKESCILIRKYARTHNNYEDNTERQRAEGYKGLTRAIKYQVLDMAKRRSVRTGERYKAKVYIDEKVAPYAQYQVYGTKSHGAVFAKRLRFFDYRAGKFEGKFPAIYREWVRGIKADDFLRNAYAINRIKVRQIFEQGLEDLTNGK